MELTPEKSKRACFIPLVGHDCPEYCVGVLATRTFDSASPDGAYVQVCPNPDRLKDGISGATYCGNGSDVVTIHRSTIPTEEEYLQAVADFDNDW